MFRTNHYQLWFAFILILSIFALPNNSFAKTNPYKIEINKRTNHLYLYKNNQVIKTYRVGTGKEEKLTPEGVFTIGSRAENPQWRDSEKNEIIPGGHKDNPLGKFWLGIKINKNDTAQTYGIHGTNNEKSVPGHVSKGCIRLKNAHIEELYKHYKIAIGTPVWIHSGVSNQKWLGEKPQEEIKSATGKIITTTQVNIRQGLSTTTSILVKVEKGKILTITGETQNWYRVKLSNGQIGFISKLYVNLYTEPTNPTQQKPDSNQNTPPASQKTEEPTKAKVSVAIKTSFTKYGSLKIDASLPTAKKASGKWKITLNDQVVADEQNEKTFYTFIQKDPKLEGKQIKLKAEFNGTVDGKETTGVKEISYNKIDEKMKITPTFKQNRFQLQASLKGNQKTMGIWIIKLGETKRVSLQSGEKLDETFDEVTFDKKRFPVKVEFKGFTDQSFVTAKYEKELKVNLPQTDKSNIDQTGVQTDSEKEKKENEVDQKEANQEEPKDSEETKDEQNQNENGLNGEQSIDNLTTSKKDDSTEEKKSTDDQESGQQEGGELPKTASHYPLGVLLGLGILIMGMCTIRFLHMKK